MELDAPLGSAKGIERENTKQLKISVGLKLASRTYSIHALRPTAYVVVQL
jgi:hypothetical protein